MDCYKQPTGMLTVCTVGARAQRGLTRLIVRSSRETLAHVESKWSIHQQDFVSEEGAAVWRDADGEDRPEDGLPRRLRSWAAEVIAACASPSRRVRAAAAAEFLQRRRDLHGQQHGGPHGGRVRASGECQFWMAMGRLVFEQRLEKGLLAASVHGPDLL